MVVEIDGQNNIAIYMRISDEDEELETGGESNSIAGQRMLLMDFIRNRIELRDYNVIEFVDDGYSGTNFDRPAVLTLLEMAKRKEVCCIIVKDFSRFGRNYLEVGNYLEQIFPFLGIRFFSVNDGFDSFYSAGAAGALDVGFKNIIYEAYSKDLSVKIKTVRKSKAEQGKFVTAFAPYGYKKEEGNRNRLIIDPECAPIVRRIFTLYLSGVTKTEITRRLNEEGIPSPMTIRKRRREPLNRSVSSNSFLWTVGTVSHILRDQRYTGDAVYGKVRPESVGSKKEIKVPKEQWILVPDAHEGIISHEEYKVAEKRIKHYKKKEKGIGTESLFAKKIRCKACSHTLTKIEKGNKIGYCCKMGRNLYNSTCYQGRIEEQQLKNVIMSCLQNFAFMASQPLNEQTRKKPVTRNHMTEIKILQQKLSKLEGKKFSLYEAYKKEKLSQFAFQEKLIELEHSVTILQNQYQTLKENPVLEEEEQSIGCFPLDTCNRAMIDGLIENITVERNGTVIIRWRFMEPFICP